MAAEAEIDQYYEHAVDTMAKVYHEVNRDGTVPAVAREAIKDVRNTIHEIFFGKSERGGESGAPLNPLFADIIEARKEHGEMFGPPDDGRGGNSGPNGGMPGPVIGPLQSPGDIANDNGHGVHGPERGMDGPDNGIYGPEAMNSPLMSPGELANDNQIEPQHHEREQEHSQAR
jgi:hypothetical protein